MSVKKYKELYSVKEICLLYNITRKTLFYYDRIDLLKPAKRQGAQRSKHYDLDSLKRLDRIRVFRNAGLNIAETKKVIDLSDINSILTVLNNVKIRLEDEKNQKENELKELDKLIVSFKHGCS